MEVVQSKVIEADDECKIKLIFKVLISYVRRMKH
jgi:hypothetical protein